MRGHCFSFDRFLDVLRALVAFLARLGWQIVFGDLLLGYSDALEMQLGTGIEVLPQLFLKRLVDDDTGLIPIADE